MNAHKLMETYKLLLITNISPALQYGIGTYIAQLIKGFSLHSNLEVAVVQLDCDIDGFLYTDDNGYCLYQIPSWRQYAEPENKKVFYDEAARWLNSYLKKEERIIFHFNTAQDEELITSLKDVFTTAKAMATVHYFDWSIALLGSKWRFRRMLATQGSNNRLEHILYKTYLKEKLFFHCLDSVICLTASSKYILNEEYGLSSDKIFVIPNGMEDKNTRSPSAIKNEILHKGDTPVLLYVGRLDKSKGVHELIRAFHDILKVHPNAHLILVGDGNFSFCLKECSHIWSHVTFTGKIDPDTLHQLYQLADLGVIPSYSEQCSYVAIEMMMHGLPIVGTNCDGLKEMLPPEYCVPIHTEEEKIYLDSNELSSMILKHLGMNGERHTFRQLYENKYRLNLMLERTKNAYQSLWQHEDIIQP